MGGGGSGSHALLEVEETFAGEQAVVPEAEGELGSKNLHLAGSKEGDAAGMDGSNDDDDGDNIVAAAAAVEEGDVDIGKEVVGLYHSGVVVAFLVETCRNRFHPP